MQWRDVEVWRRQRPYVRAEILKDAPDHLARLGLATSFVLVVGMAEGARISAVKGDLKFSIRYAIYNAVPSFVGGKVPASSVSSAMASPPPLRSCPRAAAHAANLRALRTAVAGYTALSVVFQVALAGGRGTQEYQRAVSDGCEMPSMPSAPTGDGSTGSADGVVRLCGTRGLESALAAAAGRGGYRTPILPVVISGGAWGQKRHTRSSSRVGFSDSKLAAPFLPEGALAAVAKRLPRPCYYRIDRERLFCRETWQPVAAAVVEARSSSAGGQERVIVLEADSLSSDTPQTLMSPPVRSAAAVAVGDCCDDGGGAGGGELGGDQAVWGLAMLRRALEETSEPGGGRVASVLLAERRLVDVKGSSTVSIDARAALLLSVLSWTQQCAAEAPARSSSGGVQGSSASGLQLRDGDTGEVAAPSNDNAISSDTATSSADRVGGGGDAAVGTAADSCGESRADDTAEEDKEILRGGNVEAAATAPPIDEKQAASASTAARLLGILENMGHGVRVAVAPFGQLQLILGRSLGAVSAWVERKRLQRSATSGATAAASRILFYDTDDDDSFRWLAAQMLKTGWTVERATSERLPRGLVLPDVPVLVHRCSDERTLTAAAGHLSRGAKGTSVCAVVHSWDCGLEARRLLARPRRGGSVSAVPVEVICTAEVGEDLFHFVRWQLLSGATSEQVQKGLDDLLGTFYEDDCTKVEADERIKSNLGRLLLNPSSWRFKLNG